MRSGPAATVGVLLALALVLPACGDERTATAGGESAPSGTDAVEKGVEPAAGSRAKPAAAARRCGRVLGDFLDSIESLDNSLAVGLEYEGYLRAVNHVRATYADLPAERLPLVCLARVGGPAEKALNIYIDAVNTWGECLATTSCDSESVEPQLQRRWARASDLLASAQSGLRQLR